MSFEKAKKYLQEKGYEDCSRQHRQQETLCQVGEKINSYKSMQYPLCCRIVDNKFWKIFGAKEA